MQPIKNGIKSVIRTPGKTALFTLLLAVTAAMLSVSLVVFTAVSGYLHDCDGYFHTIAKLEYVGGDYPDERVFDPALSAASEDARADIERLVSSDCVLSFEPSRTYLAYSPSVQIKDDSVYDPYAAVLKLDFISFDQHVGLWSATVSECLYSRNDLTGKIVSVSTGGRPEGTCYAVGSFKKGSAFTQTFFPKSVSFEDGSETVALPAFAPAEGSELAAKYSRYAELLSIQNDSCRAFYTASAEDHHLFHQQSASLKSGRFFTEEEYLSRARSVIISDRLSRLTGLGPGDRIFLAVYGSEGNVFDTQHDFISDSGDYEIVGVFSEGESSPWQVFLPDANADNGDIVPSNGYCIGEFRIKNSAAAEFLEAAKPLLGNGFRVSVFDQGYAAAAEPMKELLFISYIFLAVSLLLAFSALALQSYLFVSRQRGSALIMRDLGSPKRQVFVCFLSSALLVAGTAALVGVVSSRLLEGRISDLLRRIASQFAEEDLSFSDSRLAAIRTLTFDPDIPLKTYAVSALMLLAGSLVSASVFTFFTLKKPNRKRRNKAKRKRAGRTSQLSGFLKYGMLSVRRSFARSLAVALTCAAAGLFIGRAAHSARGCSEQLEAYRADARISGFATNSTGSMLDGLVVRGTAVKRLIESGEIDEFAATNDLGSLEPLGVTVKRDGTERFVPYKLPNNGLELDSVCARIELCARWKACTSLEDSPMFHFTSVRNIEWLKGFDDRIFLGSSNACAMPFSMMEEYGIELGDVVRVRYVSLIKSRSYPFANGRLFCYVNELKVVAGYASLGYSNAVYSPIGYTLPETTGNIDEFRILKEFGQVVGYTFEESRQGFRLDVWGERPMPRFFREPDMDEVAGYTKNDKEAFLNGSVETDGNFRSFIFASNDASRLQDLRAALAEGFAPVRSSDRSKGFAVIEDEICLNTIRSMTRQMQYVSAFSYALFVLAGVTGIVLAWLLTLSRRKEIAVMRALGTPPVRILLNFFAEQAALALPGVSLGAALSYLTGAPLSKQQLFLTAGFFALWCLSALTCLAVSLLKRSYAALTEPE